MEKFGFTVVDTIGGDYELLALSFDGTTPSFTANAKKQAIESEKLTIYYGLQCPYILNCIDQAKNYCDNNKIEIDLIKIDSLEKAKNLPCVFNNWAVFNNGKFETLQLLNEGQLRKMLNK